jgi:O-antigen ligase
MRAAGDSPAPGLADGVARLVLTAAVVAAPLPFGSVLGWTRVLLAALLGGLLVLVALAPGGRAWPRPVRQAAIGAAALILPACLQLVPLPPALLRALSPAGAALLAEGGLTGWHALSLNPAATRDALVWLAACGAAVALVAALFDRRRLRLLLSALVVLGAAEAFYGLIEFLSGHHRIFLFEKRYYTGSVTGTYINKNHFAGLIEMILPIAAAWLALRLRRAGARSAGLRASILEAGSSSGSLSLLLALAIAVMLAGLTLSFSIAGLALGLGACGAAAAGAWHAGRGDASRAARGRQAFAAALVLLAVALTPLALRGAGRLAIAAGEIPDEMNDVAGRSAVWSATWRMALDHPLLGTGLGTFPETLPRYRPASVQFSYTEAHQDPLQWFAEAGLLGLVGLAVVLVGAAAAVRRALHLPAQTDRCLALGVSAGLMAIALHGLVDFNFHIPANALIAAVLLGALLVLAEPAAEVAVASYPLRVAA